MIHLDLLAGVARTLPRTLPSYTNVDFFLLTFNPGSQVNWFIFLLQ